VEAAGCRQLRPQPESAVGGCADRSPRAPGRSQARSPGHVQRPQWTGSPDLGHGLALRRRQRRRLRRDPAYGPRLRSGRYQAALSARV